MGKMTLHVHADLPHRGLYHCDCRIQVVVIDVSLTNASPDTPGTMTTTGYTIRLCRRQTPQCDLLSHGGSVTFISIMSVGLLWLWILMVTPRLHHLTRGALRAASFMVLTLIFMPGFRVVICIREANGVPTCGSREIPASHGRKAPVGSELPNLSPYWRLTVDPLCRFQRGKL